MRIGNKDDYIDFQKYYKTLINLFFLHYFIKKKERGNRFIVFII